MPFLRTRRTWQAYITISYYSYLLNSLGPLTPFLRDELGLSYTVASFHFSAYAMGIILTSLVLSRFVQRFGARTMVWVGVFGIALGALLLMAGRSPVMTVAGAFSMGLLGVMIVALLNAALAEQHGEHRAVALAESTMIASLLSTLAPIAVGFFARTDLTWRGALGLMLPAAPILWLVFHRDSLGAEPEPAQERQLTTASKKQPPLPLAYWRYWTLGLLVVAVEFCIIFWASDYLETVSGLSKANAALGLSAFMGAMLVGRWLVSRLLMRSKEQRLLMISMAAALVGFLLFWLSPGPFVALIGLVLAGLGVAGQFPIINALGLATVPDRMYEGSARMTMAAGAAILLMPLLLARLADWFGLQPAYGLVLVLLVIALLLAGWSKK